LYGEKRAPKKKGRFRESALLLSRRMNYGLICARISPGLCAGLCTFT